jgi:hypothetical protein
LIRADTVWIGSASKPSCGGTEKRRRGSAEASWNGRA